MGELPLKADKSTYIDPSGGKTGASDLFVSLTIASSSHPVNCSKIKKHTANVIKKIFLDIIGTSKYKVF